MRTETTRIENPKFRALLPGLYAQLPQPGEPTHEAVQVVIEKGGYIAARKHPEWTLSYYVDPGDPPVAICIKGERIEPHAGQVLILEPETMHCVERSRSERARVSLALRWRSTANEANP